MNVLVIEDNRRLADVIVTGLGEEQITTTAVADGTTGLALARRGDADVVVLDLGLPDLDGLDLLRTLRGDRVHVPVLVLTARDAVESRVAALEAGADDYLIKPFAFAELLARLRALARRAAAPRWVPAGSASLILDDDLTARTGDRRIALSPREHALLGYLLRRRGEVVNKTDILREVFGYDFDPGTNVIEVHLAHVRKKLAGTAVTIETIRGAGIRLDGGDA